LSPAFGAGFGAGMLAPAVETMIGDVHPGASAPKSLTASKLKGIEGPPSDDDVEAMMPAMGAVVANDMGQIAQIAEMLRLEGMAAVIANDMGAMYADEALAELMRV